MFRNMVFAAVVLASSPSSAKSPSIQIPPHAVLVAQSEVNEIHAFPEVVSTSEGRSIAQSDRSYGAAVDRLYEVPLAYDASVRFFDDQFKGDGAHVLARTVTSTSTAWTVRRPDRTIAHTVVRNTSPTTAEVSEAAVTPYTSSSQSL